MMSYSQEILIITDIYQISFLYAPTTLRPTSAVMQYLTLQVYTYR